MINDRYHDVSFKYDDCFVGMIINVDGYYKADEWLRMSKTMFDKTMMKLFKSKRMIDIFQITVDMTKMVRLIRMISECFGLGGQDCLSYLCGSQSQTNPTGQCQ